MALSDAPPQDGRASLSAQSGNGAIITPMRRFPPPWTVEEHAESFIVKDLVELEKWSKLLRQPFPVDTACTRGPLINGANMERFIRSQNIERFRRLLERVTEQSDRQKIMNLLADELQKQKYAGDPR